MISIVEISLSLPDGQRISPAMGSVMHGALMERLDTEVAATLHQEGTRSYSQAVFWNAETRQNIWRFGFLRDEVCTFMMDVLQHTSQLSLRNRGYDVSLSVPRIISHLSYDDFSTQYLQSSPLRRMVNLHFLTTTSFKQQGGYVIFPDSRLIFQNLLNRWNAFAPEPLEDGISDILSCYSVLRQYRLQSRIFGVDGRHIPGFQGTMQYILTGNEIIRRTTTLLLAYAPYAGIGIKTALGMGAVTVQIR